MAAHEEFATARRCKATKVRIKRSIVSRKSGKESMAQPGRDEPES